jgi:HlyD family secretion protein
LAGPLEADINVDARDVGFIRVGDPVKLKFDAFTFIRHGTAEGVVKSISDGSFTTTEAGQPRSPYFKVRVAIKKTDLRNVPKDFRLIPGMTLEGDVLIGGRTIMSYLIEGGLRTGSEAMREP